jgi:hypothetical protein
MFTKDSVENERVFWYSSICHEFWITVVIYFRTEDKYFLRVRFPRINLILKKMN